MNHDFDMAWQHHCEPDDPEIYRVFYWHANPRGERFRCTLYFADRAAAEREVAHIFQHPDKEMISLRGYALKGKE